jgi:hypothetical protein
LGHSLQYFVGDHPNRISHPAISAPVRGSVPGAISWTLTGLPMVTH